MSPLHLFKNKIHNRGWESVAYHAGQVWVANEQPLKTDLSPSSEPPAIKPIRIQRMDVNTNSPSGQWTYPLRHWSGAIPETHGISGMEILEDGRMLVLERAAVLRVGIPPRAFEHRLYLVDFNGATDTSRLTSLVGRPYSTAIKQLLWTRRFSDHNFEGMTTGPSLSDDQTALLLISDNGYGLKQSLLLLRLASQ